MGGRVGAGRARRFVAAHFGVCWIVVSVVIVAVAGVGVVGSFQERNDDEARFEEIDVTVESSSVIQGAASSRVLYVADVSFEVAGMPVTEGMIVDGDVAVGAVVSAWYDSERGGLWKPASVGNGSPIADASGKFFGALGLAASIWLLVTAVLAVFSLDVDVADKSARRSLTVT